MEKEHFRPTVQPSSRRSPKTSSLSDQQWTPRLCILGAATLLWIALAPAVRASGLQVVSEEGAHYVAWTDGRQVALPVAKATIVGAPETRGEQWWVPTTERHGEATRLILWHGQGDNGVEQNIVREATDRVLFGPRPVVNNTGLQALIWLEGSAVRRSEVRFSLWNDGQWSAPETLSPMGPGTQTALSATVLGDGSWLAIWTAFDGEDAEVQWSRFQEGTWSKPKAVADNNRVPDITPHILTTTDGAVATWSRYDGRDYRVFTARFDAQDQGTWTPPREVGGKGTVYPELIAGTPPLLLFRQAVPAAWTALRLNTEGHPTAWAQWPTADKNRPLVRHLDAGHIELQWLRPNAEKTLDDKTQAPTKTHVVVPWQDGPLETPQP